MDVAIRTRSEKDADKTQRRDYDLIPDGGTIPVSPETREHLWGDGWREMTEAGTEVCKAVSEFDVDSPERLPEPELLAINEQARRLARSTQTLLAISREDKGR